MRSSPRSVDSRRGCSPGFLLPTLLLPTPFLRISGCKKDGSDRLYGGTVVIDEDVREEYWAKIRNRSQGIARS